MVGRATAGGTAAGFALVVPTLAYEYEEAGQSPEHSRTYQSPAPGSEPGLCGSGVGGLGDGTPTGLDASASRVTFCAGARTGGSAAAIAGTRTSSPHRTMTTLLAIVFFMASPQGRKESSAVFIEDSSGYYTG